MGLVRFPTTFGPLTTGRLICRAQLSWKGCMATGKICRREFRYPHYRKTDQYLPGEYTERVPQ